jgi:hypothetical protein
MLNKLRIPEQGMPEEDPRFALMQRWEFVDDLYEQCVDDLSRIRRALWRAPRRKTDPTFNPAAELEALLKERHPHLIEALGNFEGALLNLHGWHVNWVHLPPQLDSDASIDTSGDSSTDQLRVYEGYIKGARVGADRIDGRLAAWLAISDTQEPGHGIEFDLADIQILALDPPD